MNKNHTLEITQVISLTIVFGMLCFGIYSCQVEENKLRAKCIEARGTWVGSQHGGTGGCVIK